MFNFHNYHEMAYTIKRIEQLPTCHHQSLTSIGLTIVQFSQLSWIGLYYKKNRTIMNQNLFGESNKT